MGRRGGGLSCFHGFPAGLRLIRVKQVFVSKKTHLTSHLVDLCLNYSRMTEEVETAVCSFLERLHLHYTGPRTWDEGIAHSPQRQPIQLTTRETHPARDSLSKVWGKIHPPTTLTHFEWYYDTSSHPVCPC